MAGAGRAGGPAHLAGAARAGERGGPGLHRRRASQAGRPGRGLGPEHAPLGAGRARRATAGATLVPVNTRFTGPEALDVITRSGARALLVAGPFLGADRLAALTPRPPTPAEAAGDPHQVAGGRPARLELIVSVPVADPSRGAADPIGGALTWRDFLATAGRGDRRGGRPARRCGGPGRRQRHPVHLGHHRAQQGRDERAPAGPGRRPGLGRVRRACTAATATSWSTRSSTASATRPASWPAWSAARPSSRSWSTTPGRRWPWSRPSGSPCCPGRRRSTRRSSTTRTGPRTTCPACGWRSPGRPPSRSPWSSGCSGS